MSLDECTPLKQDSKQQQRPSFATEKWLKVVLVGSLGWALCGFALHEWHLWRQHHPVSPLQPLQAPDAPQHLVLPKPHESNTADYFAKCNPAVPETQAVSVNKGGSFLKGRNKSPLDGEKCNSEQVAVIRGLLDRLKYNFEAISPEPYSYPANVLQVLLSLDARSQRNEIAKYERSADAMGKLGDLVKFFAWGLPIPETELFTALGGDDIAEAFTRCNILRKCGSAPVYTSTVQFFPVQNTPVIVATDWPVNTAAQHQEPVKVVDLRTMSLAHNIPEATGTKALDVGSVGGVLGLVAISKGAKDVTVIQQTARSAQFAKFNSWLNLASHKLKVVQQPLAQIQELWQGQASPDFFLVLAHPSGPDQDFAVRATLELSRNLLSPGGALVMAVENQHCESFPKDYNRQFCGDDHTGDLEGSLVCRNTEVVAAEDANSQESIIYAWRGPKQAHNMDLGHQCGQFHTYHVKEFDTSEGPEACQFVRSQMLCPIPEEKRDAALQAMLDR